MCSVDVFNEGLDVPSVDTVLMLRPTESPVIFLQQLGRGLRRFEGKDHLRVIDFIGNHRSFLMKPRTLLGLGAPSTPTTADVFDALANGEFALPDGCSVDYSLGAVSLLEQLRGAAPPGDALVDFCRSFAVDEGVRPTAAQTWRSGFNPASVKQADGWFDFLAGRQLLSDEERRVLTHHGDLLGEIEKTPITKSYKLVTLRALLHEGGLIGGLPVDDLSDAAQQIIAGDPRLVADATSKDLPDPVGAPPHVWRRFWRSMPIAAWTGELSGQSGRWFRVGDGPKGPSFGPTFAVNEDDADPLAAMVAELVEYRLARYLESKAIGDIGSGNNSMVCRVSHANGRPIVFLNRRQNDAMPTGTVAFVANGERYEGDFRKEALNVARLPGVDGNALHSLLRAWFGPSAGHPGTNHRVILELSGDELVMRSVDAAAGSSGEATVPLFPTLAVACGVFADPDRQIHEASTYEVLGSLASAIDASRTFVAFARGDSMNGGADPIRHGDPLLFEWVRGIDRRDLVGERVLVEYRDGGSSVALKRLQLDDGRYVLASDNPAVAPLDGVREMQLVARLQRRLTQPEVNPLARHIGEALGRRQISGLHGDPDQRTNWQQGHVSLTGQAILLVTLDKKEMPGVTYVDHFESQGTFVWSSQTSTAPEGKKGKEVLDALETGTQLHLWVRRRKAAVTFTYCGLVVPVSHEGSKPMSVRFRLLTPLDADLARRFDASRG